jgi:hypothetical protein
MRKKKIKGGRKGKEKDKGGKKGERKRRKVERKRKWKGKINEKNGQHESKKGMLREGKKFIFRKGGGR